MNRVIKFRAWNGKEMNDFKGGLWLQDEPNILLLQFTGLLDKNGKEIYEGDIIKCRFEEVINPWVVEYNEGECGFVIWNLLNSSHRLSELGEEQDTFEVIGNIYENPELLTNK